MQCALCVSHCDYKSSGIKGEKSVSLFMHENILHVTTMCSNSDYVAVTRHMEILFTRKVARCFCARIKYLSKKPPSQDLSWICPMLA